MAHASFVDFLCFTLCFLRFFSFISCKINFRNILHCQLCHPWGFHWLCLRMLKGARHWAKLWEFDYFLKDSSKLIQRWKNDEFILEWCKKKNLCAWRHFPWCFVTRSRQSTGEKCDFSWDLYSIQRTLNPLLNSSSGLLILPSNLGDGLDASLIEL